jgi:hypothetical protein
MESDAKEQAFEIFISAKVFDRNSQVCFHKHYDSAEEHRQAALSLATFFRDKI